MRDTRRVSLSWWWCLPLGLGAAVAALSVPLGRWLADEAARTEAVTATVVAAARRRFTLGDDGDTPPSRG